jgi:hypothetical protein
MDFWVISKKMTLFTKPRQQEAQDPVALALAGEHGLVPIVFCAVFVLRNSVRKNGGIVASMDGSIDEGRYERTSERMGGSPRQHFVSSSRFAFDRCECPTPMFLYTTQELE